MDRRRHLAADAFDIAFNAHVGAVEGMTAPVLPPRRQRSITSQSAASVAVMTYFID
jgi:hypothetical protein